MDETDRSRGEAMRRRVLGDAHVDRSLGGATDFTRPMQEFVTEVAWGRVWTRDDLPPATRSLITVAFLVALNRPQELAAHTRGALNNGCSADDLRAVLHQAAIYCGFPAALDAQKVVAEVLDRAAAEPPP